MHLRNFLKALVSAVLVGCLGGPVLAQAPWVDAQLYEGRLDEAAGSLEGHLTANPSDDDARFTLGIVQFLQAVEGLGQALHHHGAAPQGQFARNIPFLRLPVPTNPNPAPVTDEDTRRVREAFLADLLRAEATLANVGGTDVKAPLAIGLVRFDLDSDGQATDEESLWRLFSAVNPRVGLTVEQAEAFVIHMDAGDVLWLRGYCHLLAAVLEFTLAHDTSTVFDVAAHQFFPNVQTPMAEFLRRGRPSGLSGPSSTIGEASDAVAMIHMLQLPVIEPERMARAHAHLVRVVELSDESWDRYMAETDNDNEWIPNPSQTSVLPGATVTPEMVEQWRAFLVEARRLLEGEVLLPFWRGPAPVGVNLRKVFHDPRAFDLVLWFQGSAALPYLEEGTVTETRFWTALNRTFRGQFFGFALWFN